MATFDYTIELESVNIFLIVPYSLIGHDPHVRVEEIDTPILESVEFKENGHVWMGLNREELTPAALKQLNRLAKDNIDLDEVADEILADLEGDKVDRAYEKARDS